MKNIQLYNEHLNEYLSLVDGQSFTFQADNQLQDLAAYTIGFSFDIEVINDDIALDSVNNLAYFTGEYATIDIPFVGHIKVPELRPNNVVLVVNGVKLFAGRLVMLGTTPTTIKCSYQANPYGRVFEYFTAKPTLRDYFRYQFDEVAHTLGSFFNRDITHDGFILYSSDRARQVIFDAPNINKNQYDHQVNTHALVPNETTLAQMEQDSIEDRYTHVYWTKTGLKEFLRSIGIVASWDMDDSLFIPFEMHFKHKVKVRMYTKKILDSYPFNHYYEANTTSEIWLLDEQSNRWLPCIKAREHTDRGTLQPTVFFAKSLRQMRSIAGMKVVGIEPSETYSLNEGFLKPTSAKLQPSPTFNVYVGQEFTEDDQHFQVFISPAFNAQQTPGPEYVDITFEIDFNKKCTDLYNGSDDYYADVPCLSTDLAFLDTKTGDFLNELSLNVKEASFLRNPMFIHKYNYDKVWSQDNFIGSVFICDDEKMISLEKEVSSDEPNSVRVFSNVGFDAQLIKQMNDTNNDQKDVEQSIIGWTLGARYPDRGIPTQHVLPVFWDKEQHVWIENGLTAVACKLVPYNVEYIDSHLVHHNYTHYSPYPDTNDYDYMYDYSDKSHLYKFTVRGYQFQEQLNFEGEVFQVVRYTTRDFVVWELECVKTTIWYV